MEKKFVKYLFAMMLLVSTTAMATIDPTPLLVLQMGFSIHPDDNYRIVIYSDGLTKRESFRETNAKIIAQLDVNQTDFTKCLEEMGASEELLVDPTSPGCRSCRTDNYLVTTKDGESVKFALRPARELVLSKIACARKMVDLLDALNTISALQ